MLIYRATNKRNGNMYVGQTTRPLQLRMNEYKYKSKKDRADIYFYNALRLYGFDNFIFEVIDTAKNIEELNDKEMYYIEYFNTIKPNGYNLALGGKNTPKTEETRKKISIAKTGKRLSEEHKKNIGLGGIGKTISEEARKKSSESQMGEKNHMFGKKGDQHPRFGIIESEETRKKISLSKKGKKNPNLGISKRKKVLCITNGIIYESVKSASILLNIGKSEISNVARGKSKQTKGFKFKYL